MGWETLLAAAVSSLVSAGASAAMTPEQESRSSALGNVPKIDEQQDPWAWFSQMMVNKGGR